MVGLAGVGELVDTPALGAGAARRGGSSPSARTRVARRAARRAGIAGRDGRPCGDVIGEGGLDRTGSDVRPSGVPPNPPRADEEITRADKGKPVVRRGRKA